MRRFLGLAVLALGVSASLMAQGNNASVYTLKDFAGVLPPVTAATPNTLFLQTPDAVLADKNGNVYVTDTGGHRVWKIDSTGKVSLVIGTGVNKDPSFGKAANIQGIGEPSGLAMDANGNLYVSDRNNNRILKIDTGGIVTLVLVSQAARRRHSLCIWCAPSSFQLSVISCQLSAKIFSAWTEN